MVEAAAVAVESNATAQGHTGIAVACFACWVVSRSAEWASRHLGGSSWNRSQRDQTQGI